MAFTLTHDSRRLLIRLGAEVEQLVLEGAKDSHCQDTHFSKVIDKEQTLASLRMVLDAPEELLRRLERVLDQGTEVVDHAA